MQGVVRFVVLVSALLLLAVPARAERCGPTNCSAGYVCCNEGCGTCVPPGSICTQQLCPWGRPHYLASERQPSPDIYPRFSSAVSLGEVDYREGNEDVSAFGISGSAGVQYYVFDRVAVKTRTSVTELFSSDDAGAVETGGYAILVGMRGWLPDVGDSMRWAVVLDGEHADGLDLARSLAPLSRGDQRSLSFASGLAMSGMPHELGPITWFARYLHSDTSEKEPLRALDLGVGAGTYLTSWSAYRRLGARAGYRYTHELASPGYRAHEIELELAFRVSRPISVSVEGELTRFTGSGTYRAVVLRFDCYWETEE